MVILSSMYLRFKFFTLLLLLFGSQGNKADEIADCNDENEKVLAFCEEDDNSEVFLWNYTYNLKKHRQNVLGLGNSKYAYARQGRALLFAIDPTAGNSTDNNYNVDDIRMKLNSTDWNQCKNVLASDGEDFVLSSGSVKTKDVFVSMEPLHSHLLVKVYDPNCIVYIDLNDTKFNGSNIYGVYNVPHAYIAQETLPNNENVSIGTFDKLPYYKTDPEIPHKASRDDNYFKERVSFDKGSVNCYKECQMGSAFTYTMGVNQQFSAVLTLESTCEWMKVLLVRKDDATEMGFDPFLNVDISLRHGFVVMPAEIRATAISFRTPSTNKYRVFVSYEVVSDGGKVMGKLTIFNEKHQMVQKTQIGHSSQFGFAFSKDQCLAEPIRSISGLAGLHYRSAMRWAVGSDSKVYRDTTISEEEEVEIEDNKDVVTTTAVAASTTTAKPEIIPEFVSTEGPRTVKVANNSDAFVERIIHVEAPIEKKKSQRGSWYIWAVAAGFAAGSITTLALANLVFYFLSRSIFTSWYREMYKRYSSDDTGSTMHTVGGETVVAADTICDNSTKTDTSAMSTIGGDTTTGTTATTAA